jgi:AraC-like DNA-binding protein
VTRYRAGIRASAKTPQDLYSLNVSRVGRCEHTVGKLTSPIDNGHAVLGSPSMRPSFRTSTGYEGTQILIPRSAMENACAALTGSAPRSPPCFQPLLRTTTGVGASTVRLLGFVIDELDRDDAALRSPIVADRLVEAFLYSLLLEQPHTLSHLLHARAPAPEPRYIRQIEEYMEAHVDSSITLADLARLTHRSVRSIHAGFLSYRSYTPMAFLRERRLELARKRLLSGASLTVTTVSVECGFSHLGRFSIEYRARFGESPRETLRRAAGVIA